ncbi:MAG: T9SS type A sorting domain-containing protein, partial [Bacteroidia bacterium]|nr:T9SS type A sorting domain-containing protein [Bacteroidia bacterium]
FQFNILDTPGNIWQIGPPLKNILDTTLTPPNVLITDTINPYPPNNISSFELRFRKPYGYDWLCWSYMTFGFSYKIDTDTLRDGFYIEISYNGSNEWTNILYDDVADVIFFHGIYPETDTLFNGESGFSRIVDSVWDWGSFGCEWFWDNENADLIDSAAIRVTFISDSIDTQKEGVMLDFIIVVVEDRCSVSVNAIQNNKQVVIFPNPVTQESMIILPGNDFMVDNLIVYDVAGRVIIDDSDISNKILIGKYGLLQGIYFYTIISCNGTIYNGKFIITNL